MVDLLRLRLVRSGGAVSGPAFPCAPPTLASRTTTVRPTVHRLWGGPPDRPAVRAEPLAHVNTVRLEVVQGLPGICLTAQEERQQVRVSVAEAVARAWSSRKSRASAVRARGTARSEDCPIPNQCLPTVAAGGALPEDAVITGRCEVGRRETWSVDHLDELSCDIGMLGGQTSWTFPEVQGSPAKVRARPRRRLLRSTQVTDLYRGCEALERFRHRSAPQPWVAFVVSR